MSSARVTVPPRSPDHLRRPRLVDKLHENVHRRLVLISAAAGYGKTSLLADFAHDADQPVAWLRLVEADRDLVVLVADLVRALRVPFPNWQSLLPALAGQPGSQPLGLATALIHEIETDLDDYFVVVLDDFHLVDDVPAIAAFFEALLAGLPEQAHLIMAGRTLPRLPFPRLVQQQQIAGLSEEHLAFTAEEAQALLKLRSQAEVTLEEAAALVADTEGWITGILLTSQLTWQGLPARLVGARHSQAALFSYLADEVLDRQPPELRQFLLESAVLPEMEPPVCDAVLGRSDSAQWLTQAEQRRLFVGAVGEETRAYQYHHLFRDFLLARMRGEAPERLQSLQARAAAWFAANDLPEAAVTYYVHAGCMSEAADLCEQHAKPMFTGGRHATLTLWGEQLAPVAEQAPRLYVYLASIYLERRAAEAAARALDIAAAGYARRGDAAGLVEVALRRIFALFREDHYEQALALAEATAAEAQALGQSASHAAALRYAGRCHQARGDLAAAEECFQAASVRLQGSEHHYDLALLLMDLSHVRRLRGKTSESARAQQQALSLLRAVGAMAPMADLLNNIGWDLHMLGQYETALATYAEAWQWAHRSGHAYGEMNIVASQADLLADLGDWVKAATLYQQAMKAAEAAGAWATLVYLNCAVARLERWKDNYAGALEWLRRAELIQAGRRVDISLSNVQALFGMTLVEMGRLNEGRERLAQTCRLLESAETPIDLAQTLLFLAYAEFRTGHGDAAATLARALEVAERIGYDQMLLSEVPRTRPLLTACQARPELGPRVTALLSRADAVREARARLAASGMIAPEAAEVKPRPAGLEVRALGPARILRDGVEISSRDWRSQRPREMFLFLVDRAPVARDEVLRTFWPDMAPARAVANLYQTLYRLRRAVGGDVLVLEDLEFRLAPGAELHYDVERFEAQARLALSYHPSELRRLGALAAAASLYTGDYLDELAVDWAAERRRALSDLRLKVLCEYADELLHLTLYEEARAVLAQALRAEPLRDDLHARMLTCLAAMGRRHEVVSHYRRYRETLRAELGLDPPADVRGLYASLIR